MSWSTSRLRRLLSYFSPRNQLHVTGFAIFSSNSHKLCTHDLRLHEAALCVWNKDVGHPEQFNVIVSSDGDLFVQSNVFLGKDLSVLCAKSFLCFPWEGHVVVNSIFLSWRTNGSKRKRDRHHHVKVVKEKMTSEWQWLSISSSRLKRQEEETRGREGREKRWYTLSFQRDFILLLAPTYHVNFIDRVDVFHEEPDTCDQRKMIICVLSPKRRKKEREKCVYTACLSD